MKEYIESSIDKFMMIVKLSEDRTKQNFIDMQETFDALIRRYVAKKKTDKDMKNDQIENDLKYINISLKRQNDEQVYN